MNKKFLQSLFLGSGLLLATSGSFATIHHVGISDNVFSPATLNVSVGDTIEWMFMSGMQIHTTTSTTIPPGAAPWDQVVNTATPTFRYKITVAGTYNYECTPHAGMGMVASFTAMPTAAVGDVETRPFTISPNPAKNSISFKGNIKSLNVNVYDLNGRKLSSFSATNISEKTFSIQDLSQGMYILDINIDGKSYNEKLVVNK